MVGDLQKFGPRYLENLNSQSICGVKMAGKAHVILSELANPVHISEVGGKSRFRRRECLGIVWRRQSFLGTKKKAYKFIVV